MIARLLLLALFLTGFAGILMNRNLIKKIIGLNILNSSVVIFFILEGHTIGESTPIMGKDVRNIVDPVPQALMLTAIVIGVCVTALALALAFRLYRASGSFDIDEIRAKLHD